MDPVKYRNLFLEEATEHLAEMGGALLELEKDPRAGEALDLVFRMAHSIKGMSASLGYDGMSELSHRLEDLLGAWRASGRVEDPGELALLFRALEGLERMTAHVRESGGAPPADPELVAEVAAASARRARGGAAAGAPPKKAPGRARPR